MSTYLVTGANRGLGLEFARQLLARGDMVLACCRQPDAAAELRALAPVGDSRLTLLALDVADSSAVAALPGQLAAYADRLDVLVNNAGLAAPQERFGGFDEATMARVLHVNAVAPMLVTQALTPLLAKSTVGAKVVYITSELGSIEGATGLNFGLSYGMSKAALNMGAKKLASTLRKQRIASVLLHPGWVQTDMGGRSAPVQPAESIRGMLRVIDALTSRDELHYRTFEGGELPW